MPVMTGTVPRADVLRSPESRDLAKDLGRLERQFIALFQMLRSRHPEHADELDAIALTAGLLDKRE